MAIIVPIPGPLGRRLNRLRRLLDPAGREALPAHVPLVGPFQARPPFLPLEQHCWRACHRTAPFSVELGPLAVDEEERLVYAEVAPDRLVALREALLTGKDAPPGRRAPFQPRALVARLELDADLALAQWETAAAEARASFYLERIGLMARYPDGAWYERDSYTLDRAVSAV